MKTKTYRRPLLALLVAIAIGAGVAAQGAQLEIAGSSGSDAKITRESSLAGSKGDQYFGRESSLAGSAGGDAKITRESA